MNKSQLIEALSSQFEGNKSSARHALESVVNTITREVAKGEKVAITGFGAFEKAVRPARMVRNPRTGERTRAKKTAVPKFRPGASLKAVVSGAKKLPKVATPSATKSSGPANKSTSRTAASRTTGGTASASRTAAKKTTAKTASSRTSPAKKTSSTTGTARKTAAKKTTAKTAAGKAPAKKATAKTTTAKKTTAKTASSRTSTPAKKTSTSAAAKKSPAKRSAAKKSSSTS